MVVQSDYTEVILYYIMQRFLIFLTKIRLNCLKFQFLKKVSALKKVHALTQK